MKMRFIQTRRNRQNQKSGEKGQALLLVLVLILVAALIITSTLAFIGASIKTNRPYIQNTNDLYAAEAGVQDGMYNILNKSDPELDNLLNTNNFSEYDYTDTWSYTLPNPVNGDNVIVKIKNIWVPYGITEPSLSDQAEDIINNVNGASGVNLTISGGVYSIPTYRVDVSYNGPPLPLLPILSIGVWLPQGYTYNNSSSQLASTVPGTTEQVVQCAGNEAVIWTFPSGTTFQGLLANTNLNPNGNTQSFSITFTYNTSIQNIPDALSWINVTTNADFIYSYTWDADIQDYDLKADAGNTEVESNVPKSATRALGTAINGDYVAIGNSLMIMGQGTPTKPGTNIDGIRYTSLSDNPYTLTTIPSNADIQGAYLYWTGWFDDNSKNNTSDLGTSNPENENANIFFSINGNEVYYDSSGNPHEGTGTLSCLGNKTVHQTDTDPTVGGYSYSCEVDVTKLIQTELARETPNALNYPGNAKYDVGPAPNCSLGDTGNQGSYAGWSLVIIYSSPSTLGHQLYLYDLFSNCQGAYEGGSDIDVTTGGQGPGGTISGFIVPPQDPNTQDLLPTGTNSQGVNNYDPAATLTMCVGEGDWCYAGDFLAFNAPQPKNLTDAENINNFNAKNLLWDGITLPDATQGTSHLPNTYDTPGNVWNSTPQNQTSQEWTPNGYQTYTLPQYEPSTQDGMDIKTFVILWESGLLTPGVSSARIDIPTNYDQFNLVYIILSFRSSVTSGGPISYLVRNIQ
jgi:hypothetical protein